MEKELLELLKDDGSKITPEKMRDRIHALVVNVNKSRKPISLRRPREILDDLVEAVRRLESLRDDEWDFADRHGIDGMFWDEDVSSEHDELLDDIQKARNEATRLVREATGNDKLEV